MDDELAKLAELALTWLDIERPRTDHEITLRVMKIAGEAGEVVDAYEGWIGHNPRKGVYATQQDVYEELCDIILTAAVTLGTLAGDIPAARKILSEFVEARTARFRGLLDSAPSPG